MARFHVVTDAKTGFTEQIPFSSADEAVYDQTAQTIAAELATATALARVQEIRLDIVDHLLALQVGTPAEKAAAQAAMGTLKAELALQKSKL